jgi:hypothetical protein
MTIVQATVRRPSRDVQKQGEHVVCQCIMYGYPDPQSVRRQLPRLLEVHDWSALLDLWIITHERIPDSLQTRFRSVVVDLGQLYTELHSFVDSTDRQRGLFTTTGRRSTL